MIAEIYITSIIEGQPMQSPFNIEVSTVPRKGERISLEDFMGDADDHGRYNQFKEDYIKWANVKDTDVIMSRADLLIIGVTHKVCEAGHFVSLEVIFKF